MKKHKKRLPICYGISQSYISRLEKKIISKMKKDIMSKTRIIMQKCWTTINENDIIKATIRWDNSILTKRRLLYEKAEF